MTVLGVVAVVFFVAGLLEGVMRGGWGVAGGAIVGATAGLVVLAAIGLGAAVRWLLPAGWRRGPWARAIGWAALGFVAGEFLLARWLALNFKDPQLVALVAAVGGVGIAFLCLGIGVPVVVRLMALEERWGWRWVRWGGVVVMIGGGVAFAVRAGKPLGVLEGGAIALVRGVVDVAVK